MIHAYLFEAKGIQRYLFASGRMRDVVGGSDLVAQIASSDGTTASGKADWIGEVLTNVPITVLDVVTAGSPANEVSFSRRASACFCLHGQRDALLRVRRAIRLKVMRELPGLEFTDALTDEDDFKNEDGELIEVIHEMAGFKVAMKILNSGRSGLGFRSAAPAVRHDVLANPAPHPASDPPVRPVEAVADVRIRDRFHETELCR